VFSHASVQIGTRPFDFHIYDTIQDAIDFFYHHWELKANETNKDE
jgi:hypothetical protein